MADGSWARTLGRAGAAADGLCGKRCDEQPKIWRQDGHQQAASSASGSVLGLSAGDGSVTSANDSVNGDSTYTYDNLNRLATMSSPYNPSGCYGLPWTYDSVGNRTAQSVTSGSCPTFSAAVNSNNQLAGWSCPDSCGKVKGVFS